MALRMQSSSASSEQIEVLLEFLQEHSDLAQGYIRGPEARDRSRRLWADLTIKCNSLGGAVKTSSQWQKVWADRKHLAKKVAALRNAAATRTGGGPSVRRQLTDTEQRVLAIMGEGFGLPQTTVRTPAILNDENVELDLDPQTVQNHEAEESVIHNWGDDLVISLSPAPQDRESIRDHIYYKPPTGYGVDGSSVHTSNNSPVHPPSGNQARRLRWNSQHRQLDLRSQLLESEDEKLVELAGIRAEMAGARTAVAGVRAELATLNQNLTSLVEELKNRS